MNEALGIAIVLLGQLIALVVRLFPDGKLNALIPRIVWAANFLGILAGFASKLVQAIGPAPAPAVSGGAALAIGGILTFVKAAGSVFLATGLGAVQSWIWEQFGKKAVPKVLLDAGKGV